MLRTATPTNTPTKQAMPVPHDKIAARAYEKWCRRGRPHGTAMQDWLEAERELQLESARMAAQGTRR
ncbi:MAG TPA: DUF2934 domain-containing protein [Gemmataceae bacterium]|nr:DUF2934 domain-containing protein [Gemmataceae bacterium]